MLFATYTHTRRRIHTHTEIASHMVGAEYVVLWQPNEIIAAALHPLLGLLAYAYMCVCVSVCVCVCVCYLERLTIAAIINCSQSHFRFFMRFDYFALGLCQFSVACSTSLFVIEYIILLYLPHTHTRERDKLANRVSGI